MYLSFMMFLFFIAYIIGMKQYIHEPIVHLNKENDTGSLNTLHGPSLSKALNAQGIIDEVVFNSLPFFFY